jgi:hypothetical protein
MPKMTGSTRSALCASACAVVREPLRLLEIGYEIGYKTRGCSAIVSSGAGLRAQFLFNAQPHAASAPPCAACAKLRVVRLERVAEIHGKRNRIADASDIVGIFEPATGRELEFCFLQFGYFVKRIIRVLALHGASCNSGSSTDSVVATALLASPGASPIHFFSDA